jgi:GNAT superfamily N-acetyltransferase
MTFDHAPIDRFEVRAPTEREEKNAFACLKEHAAEAGASIPDNEAFSVLAMSGEKVIGGLIGYIFWNWLYAYLVWVEKPYRRKGVGQAVLKQAEEKALQRRLTGIYLWTESWQAPDFYTRMGYEEFVEFENFPPNFKRFGFRKYL